jgi:hypothetical protein
VVLIAAAVFVILVVVHHNNTDGLQLAAPVIRHLLSVPLAA